MIKKKKPLSTDVTDGAQTPRCNLIQKYRQQKIIYFLYEFKLSIPGTFPQNVFFLESYEIFRNMHCYYGSFTKLTIQ